MAFEEIERLAAAVAINALPSTGLRISTRRAPSGRGKEGQNDRRFIVVQIGAVLARRLKLIGEKSALRIMFGTGEDAGKIGLTVDQTAGRFKAHCNKAGAWLTNINAKTAAGLFALEFPAFCVIEPPVLAPDGQPPIVTFDASPEMLAAD